LGNASFAQLQRASIGIGTNGIGVSSELQIQKQFSFGSAVNYLLIKGTTVNYLLDNFVKTDYKTNSLQLEGFVKWYPQSNQRKSTTVNQNRFYAKAGLAIRFNPSFDANSTFMDKTMIGSFELNKEQVGYVNINIQTKHIQPMLAAGYSIVDKKKFFINTEAGVYFHGIPQVSMKATGTLHLNDINQAAIQKTASKYQYFPLLKLETGIKL
jgi:hypothetical protein